MDTEQMDELRKTVQELSEAACYAAYQIEDTHPHVCEAINRLSSCIDIIIIAITNPKSV